MTPTQREAALRLADTETQWRALKWEQDVIALLRELASELQAEPVRECADNDSPWLVCKTCAAVGRCAKQDEPVAWLIVDKDGTLMHAVGWREAAHEHINDAINEHDLAEAAEWKVVPAYAAPQQRKPLSDEQIYAAISDQVFWATSKNFIVRVVRDVERAHGIVEAP